VIGEYAYVLGEDYQMEELLEKITKLTSYTFTDPRTLSWVFNSITRLIALMGYIPEHVHSQVVLHYTSEDTEVQQRCSELIEFSSHLQLMQKVLPLDSSCEDLNVIMYLFLLVDYLCNIQVDSSLSFLDNFVSQALVNGAPPYKPPHLRLTENFSNRESGHVDDRII
jgi:AP-4 complex subunit epsilon-1